MPLNALKINNPAAKLAFACLLASICSPALSAERILSKPDKTWPGNVVFGNLFAWLPDNKSLVSADGIVGAVITEARFNGAVRVWDADTGKATRQIVSGVVDADKMAVSRDGTKVACLGFGGVLQVWDLKDGTVKDVRLRDLPRGFELSDAAITLEFTPEGDTVALDGAGGLVIVDVINRDWSLMPRSKNTLTIVWASGFSRDGKTLFARHGDVIDIWEWPTRKLRTSILVSPKPKGSDTPRAAISSDGKLVAAADDDGASRTFTVWDATTGKVYSKSKGKHKNVLWTMAFAPIGGVLVTESGGDVRLWDVHKGDLLATIPPTNKKTEYADFAISLDGKRLATLDSQIMRIWDISEFTDRETSSSDSPEPAKTETKKQDKKPEKPKPDNRSKTK